MERTGQRGTAHSRLIVLAFGFAPLLAGCADVSAFFDKLKGPMQTMTMPAPQQEVAQAEPAPEAEMPAEAMPEASEPPKDMMASVTPKPMTRRPAPMTRRPVPPRTSTTPASISPPPMTSTTPGIAPSDLVGLSFDSVLERLRKPDTVEKNALSVVWTYSEPDCTLQLYFYPDIQTTIFHLLKYDLKGARGEKLNDSGACMQLMAMRKDGTAQSPRAP